MPALEDEWYVVRYSGEIPEVALHSARYHLTEDPDGPRLSLSAEQWQYLVEAAAERYQEIILRDLLQANKASSAYRGIKRSMINWQRFRIFCARHKIDYPHFRTEVASALACFITEELDRLENGAAVTPLNCSYKELCRFVEQLGLSASQLPQRIVEICAVRH